MKVALLLGLALACGRAGSKSREELPPEGQPSPAMPVGNSEGASQTREERVGMSQDAAGAVLSVHYSRDFGWFGSEAMMVGREAEGAGEEQGVFSLGYNHDGGAEIGVWRHTVPAAMFAELVRRLDASGWLQLEAPTVLRPGQSTVSVGVRRAGEKGLALKGFPPGKPELAEVMKSLDEIKVHLRQHPLRVLRGEARWGGAELKAGGRLELVVVLTNVGREPLQIPHPAQAAGALRLGFLRSNGEQAAHVALGSSDVTPGADTPAAAVARLAPGQTLTFTVRTKVPVAPGRYAVRLSVVFGGGSSGDGLTGTLDLNPGLARVQ